MDIRKWMKYVSYLLVATCFSFARAGTYEDFFKAVELDDARTVSALLQRGFDPNSRSPDGQLAFALALRQQSPKVAEALWAHPQLEIDVANANGETPLMIAALGGQVEWMQRLIARGAKVQRSGWTPLHYAASGPEPKAVALLLDAGAAIDARGPNGSTPLMMAVSYGNSTSVQILLERGADRSLVNQHQRTAADYARALGRDRMAAQLSAPGTR
jgi:ankyrin repeat protein